MRVCNVCLLTHVTPCIMSIDTFNFFQITRITIYWPVPQKPPAPQESPGSPVSPDVPVSPFSPEFAQFIVFYSSFHHLALITSKDGCKVTLVAPLAFLLCVFSNVCSNCFPRGMHNAYSHLLHLFYLFPTVCLIAFLQCWKVTLVAFLWLFTTVS